MKACNQCGKCCIKYGDGGIEATVEEIDLWEIFRPDIYQFVRDYKIWYEPNTQQPLNQCPFLEIVSTENTTKQVKYTCGIYEDRPEDCRLYPSSITEMIRDECEMIEIIDLSHPKQAKIAFGKLINQ
ncbi:YkgJ family cysteine cluster protein [Colwellia sp. 1_MG-2023]|uniref:YkgJ family cysteine cluster protein n=1 Tax=Colwellia sp. 1_MG-2023 TaxID=3062649 RepID=UPI0026E3320F|nr:YkgJ family cysteine cluster protein [Colwellia sp. 1_MG-2023]MDO6447523.1 YkgJ family cysteine cluster protein [Colwellia sp. 1_MG-2023]